ncbi:hypothetical protein SAMN05421545_3977 [Pontibacter lucknowensis]|uniref:Uncharacterized protein n=2 Tax=Pontibacter lucknowensis TaxID=1077936 RepID=A0A1N7BJ16_9BACT|nr:hypothetical protein SAMN05421545_3977 [Pontibacter lucknowensis]
MPETRKADYYLGCLDGSVFIDFNRTKDNRIYLVRISFDGYGCCNLEERAKGLNPEDSKRFVEEIEKKDLNQKAIEVLVKKAVEMNKELIWADAIVEYGLIE